MGKEEKEGGGEHEVFVLTNRLQCITEGSLGKAGTDAQISDQCCLLACFFFTSLEHTPTGVTATVKNMCACAC